MKKTTTTTNKQNKIAKVTRTRKAAGAATDLSWEAVETMPRKRWWWWLATGYVAFFLTCVLATVGNWSAALVVAVGTIALGYTYGSKPRTRNYTLGEHELRINDDHYDLSTFRVCVLEHPSDRKRGSDGGRTLILLPYRRLGVALTIFLPDGDNEQARILEALDTHVPRVHDTSYTHNLRWLGRIAHWLKLE